MARQTIIGYGPSDIVGISGQPGQTDYRLRLDPNWDAQSDGYTYQIYSDPGEADELDDGEFDDESQYAHKMAVSDGETTVAAGMPSIGYKFVLIDPEGDTINLYSIEIDGAFTGFVADGEIQPGTTYSFKYTYLGATGNDAEAIYQSLNSASYDHDADNAIEGGDNGDYYAGDAGDDKIDGGGGDDTLVGGAGNDALSGGAGNDLLGGMEGDDVLTGGAGNDTFYLTDGGGNDTITDFDVGDDDGDGVTNDQLNLQYLTGASGDPITVSDVAVSDDGSGNAVLTFPNGESVTLKGVSPAEVNSKQLIAMGVPCFTPGTRLLTPHGLVPVETLKQGDLVTTQDHGDKPIRYISTRSIDGPQMRDNHLPVLISAGSLGPGIPRRDLVVSGWHRMLLNWKVVRDRYGEAEVLAPAKALTPLAGIRLKRGVKSVQYIHLLLDRHEVIFAEGAPTESFYPGPTILREMGALKCEELYQAAPALRQGVEAALGPPARTLLKVQEARKLVIAHKIRLKGEIAKWDADQADEKFSATCRRVTKKRSAA